MRHRPLSHGAGHCYPAEAAAERLWDTGATRRAVPAASSREKVLRSLAPTQKSPRAKWQAGRQRQILPCPRCRPMCHALPTHRMKAPSAHARPHTPHLELSTCIPCGGLTAAVPGKTQMSHHVQNILSFLGKCSGRIQQGGKQLRRVFLEQSFRTSVKGRNR